MVIIGLAEGFFEFVSKRSLSRTGNISRCTRKMILDLSNISVYLLQKIKSKVTSDIYNAKIVAKMLFHISCILVASCVYPACVSM